MAAIALAWQLVLEIAGAVAILAVDASVHALEREARLLRVIELRRLPARGRVAVAALGPALAVVHVVRRVAGRALLRCALVAIAEVALHAGHFDVLVAQRIRGLVVIEVHVAPGRGVVAGRAVLPELAFMRLVLLVARQRTRAGASRNALPGRWQLSQASVACAPSRAKSVMR